MRTLSSSLFKSSSSSSSSSDHKSSGYFKSDDKGGKKSWDFKDDDNGKGKGHDHGNGKGHDSHGNGNGYGHDSCGDDDGQTDNKPAVFSGSSAGSVQEDGTLTAGGTMVVTDPDAGESAFASTGSLQGEYGQFSFNLASGVWSYALDNANTDIQALDANEILTDSLLVTSTDGSSTELTVTINGADEAPPADPALVWVIDLASSSIVRTDLGATAPIYHFGNDSYSTISGFTANDVLNHNGMQLAGTYEDDVDGDGLVDDTVASFLYAGNTKTLEVGLINFVGINPAVNLATDLIPV